MNFAPQLRPYGQNIGFQQALFVELLHLGYGRLRTGENIFTVQRAEPPAGVFELPRTARRSPPRLN